MTLLRKIAKMNQQSALKTAHNTDFFGEKLAKLRQILPEIFSENTLDLEKLKTLLGDHLAQNERYGLNWAGKSAAYQALQRPTHNTLVPCPAESVDFDSTQNIFIESDNLEALKILQKSYAGKIKMIYIDPPYNTGNDFIYHDDFSQSKKDYEIATGDRNTNGELLKSFKKNSKDNGHYHSNWLNMMLPRLHLARTLLSDDGVIFISIDDNEQAQLKLLCDEIFGGENVEVMIWNKEAEGKSGTLKQIKRFRKIHEYIVVACKNKEKITFSKIREALKGRENEFQTANLAVNSEKENTNHENYFTITNPNGLSFTKQWKWSKDEINELIKEDLIYWGSDGKKQPRLIIPTDDRRKIYIESILNYGGTTIGGKDLKDLMGKEVFSYPKPIILLEKLIESCVGSNETILDFFAGTSTITQAVFSNNIKFNRSNKFIMVQLPEVLDANNSTSKEEKQIIQNAIDFCNENNLPTNIAEISKERIRRAGAKIKAENPEKKIDTGFKVFKLSDSNFKAWQIDDDISKQLEMYIDPLKDNANEMDIVYELLLKMGLKLTATIECNNGVYWLTCENKSYAIVLNLLSQDDFNAIIAQKPTKTVVLDKAFLNDSEKSNVMLQFKDAGLNFESI